MILYFTATGNCQYVAEEIAAALNDKAYDLVHTKGPLTIKAPESLGIVCPTYFWNLPKIIEDLFATLEIKTEGDPYIFSVSTYGLTAGGSYRALKKLFKNKGLSLHASYGVRTVDNYSPIFDLNDAEKIEEGLTREASQTKQVIDKIKNRDEGNFIENQMPVFISVFGKIAAKGGSKTESFHAEDSCIGCGLCAQNCPVNAIEMVDGKPQWTKASCAMCLRCLHHCPSFAIQYGDRTQAHGQYLHPAK